MCQCLSNVCSALLEFLNVSICSLIIVPCSSLAHHLLVSSVCRCSFLTLSPAAASVSHTRPRPSSPLSIPAFSARYTCNSDLLSPSTVAAGLYLHVIIGKKFQHRPRLGGHLHTQYINKASAIFAPTLLHSTSTPSRGRLDRICFYKGT